jgi:hydrogenase maturation factor HypF (carbamoyltransferase family)
VRQEINYEAQAAIELENLVLPNETSAYQFDITEPETQNPKPETRNPKPKTQNPKPKTQNPKPETQNPKPETQNPKPETQNPKPKTRNPKPETHPLLLLDPTPVIQAVVADVRAGVSPGVIAAKFHNGLAHAICDICVRLREETGLTDVALSGGVFQNVTLLGKTVPLLEKAGFTVYTHRLVPPNDGGLALGQAIIAGVRETQ